MTVWYRLLIYRSCSNVKTVETRMEREDVWLLPTSDSLTAGHVLSRDWANEAEPENTWNILSLFSIKIKLLYWVVFSLVWLLFVDSFLSFRLHRVEFCWVYKQVCLQMRIFCRGTLRVRKDICNTKNQLNINQLTPAFIVKITCDTWLYGRLVSNKISTQGYF